MELTDRETAHVLAALRYSQRPGNDIRQSEHFADTEPLSDAEIDDLCERLNCDYPIESRYTVVGLWPDFDWAARNLQQQSFAEHIEAKCPEDAIRKARLQMARRRLGSEDGNSESPVSKETADMAKGIAIIACFQGHLQDKYQADHDEV